MIVLLFEQRFVEAIESRRKVHSIRRERVRPIRRGDALSLRAWDGKPYRKGSKKRTILDTTCLAVLPIWIWPERITIARRIDLACEWDFQTIDELDAFAHSDGFDDWLQMRTYRDWNDSLPFKGELILWDKHPLLQGLLGA